MQKTYELNDNTKKSQRLYRDFNLYGFNLNRSFQEEIDDLIKYGRTK